jgi:hypothetical protein
VDHKRRSEELQVARKAVDLVLAGLLKEKRALENSRKARDTKEGIVKEKKDDLAKFKRKENTVQADLAKLDKRLISLNKARLEKSDDLLAAFEHWTEVALLRAGIMLNHQRLSEQHIKAEQALDAIEYRLRELSKHVKLAVTAMEEQKVKWQNLKRRAKENANLDKVMVGYKLDAVLGEEQEEGDHTLKQLFGQPGLPDDMEARTHQYADTRTYTCAHEHAHADTHTHIHTHTNTYICRH